MSVNAQLLTGCPFAGIVCQKCNKKVGGAKYSELTNSIKSHVSKCWDVDVSSQDRRQLWALVSEALKTAAIKQSRLTPSAQKGFLLEHFLLPVKAYMCTACMDLSQKKKTLNDRHKSRTCRSTPIEVIDAVASKHCQSILVPASFSASDDQIYWPLYASYLGRGHQLGIACTILDIPDDPLGLPLPLQARPQIHIPSKAFSSKTTPQVIFDCFSKSINTLSGSKAFDKERFTNELQGMVTESHCFPELVSFAMETFGPVAFQYFDSSWHSMASYLTSGTEVADQEWEHNLLHAASTFFDLSYGQLANVNHGLRVAICEVGKYRTQFTGSKLKEAAKKFMEDMDVELDEHGDLVRGPNDSAKDELVREVVALLGNESSNGMPRRLGTLSRDTMTAYRSEFVKFILFVLRKHADFVNNDTCQKIKERISCLKPQEYLNQDGKDRAMSLVAILLLLSMDLESMGTYTETVMKEPTLPGLYVMAKTIDVSIRKNADYLFRAGSPYQLHSSVSKLLYSLRLGFLACMVHASITGNCHLQSILAGPEVFVRSRASIDLASLARVGRNFETFCSRGVQPATYSKLDDEKGGLDIFTIPNSSNGLVVQITRQMFKAAGQRAITGIHDDMKKILCQALIGSSLPVCEVDRRQEPTYLLLSHAILNQVVDGILGSTPMFYDCGVFRQFVSQFQQKRALNGQVKETTQYASTISAEFQVTLLDGKIYCVKSSDLAILLGTALEKIQSLQKSYDAFDYSTTRRIGAFMQFGTRGTARVWEQLYFSNLSSKYPGWLLWEWRDIPPYGEVQQT
jgi:hypothetical protein